MEKKIRIGISSCLLGNPVRYDGNNKSDYYIKHSLDEFVEWVPVCPEKECGLTVPREAMQLTDGPGLFANSFISYFNSMPFEDDEGISDPEMRKSFMKKTGIWSD